jgi:hypothetical protein
MLTDVGCPPHGVERHTGYHHIPARLMKDVFENPYGRYLLTA